MAITALWTESWPRPPLDLFQSVKLITSKTVKLTTPQYVAISPYNKHHYFVAFQNRSIRYDFTGAPAEWMRLMTEVFDAWAAERLQKPQQQFLPPNTTPYPQAQLHQPLQPQQQAAYYYNNNNNNSNNDNNSFIAELPLASTQVVPMSPPLTPSTPSMGYPSPALQNVLPCHPYASQTPLQGAIELPAELPGNMTLVPPPVPARAASTEVSIHCPVFVGCKLILYRKRKSFFPDCFNT